MKTIKLLGLMIVILCISSVSYSQTPFSFGLTGGANFPMSDFNDAYKMGFSVEGVGFYAFPSGSMELSLTIGYNGFTYKNEYFTDPLMNSFDITEVKGFDVSWTAADIPVMAGIKYNLPTPVVSPYFWGEIGAHFLSFSDRIKKDAVIGTSSSNKILNITDLQNHVESGSETAFGYAIGAGITIPILPKIGLDINVKYIGNGGIFSNQYTVVQNATSSYSSPEVKNMSFLTTRLGILISL
jgi:opacity protein-like surface antigen